MRRTTPSRPRPARRPGLAAALSVLVVLAAAPALAQQLPATRPTAGTAKPLGPDVPATRPAVDVAAAFADLAHPEPAVRESARDRLMGLGRSDLPRLRRVVADARPLAAAQAVALREIVTHAYLADDPFPAAGGRGFLGVTLGQVDVLTGPAAGRGLAAGPGANPPEFNPFDGRPRVPGTTAVVIVDRMPGFVGSRAFHDGDVVLGMAARPYLPTRTVDDLKDAVGLFAPGETVAFDVLRQGQVTRVPVTLDARPAELPDAAGFAGLEAMRQFRQRRQADADGYWAEAFAPMLGRKVG